MVGADDGLYLLDKKSGASQRLDNPKDFNNLSDRNVYSIYVDSKTRLWFASEGGGVCKYNYETDNFTTIGLNDGLPNSVVYSILDDKYGNIWLSTFPHPFRKSQLLHLSTSVLRKALNPAPTILR
jgi:ligand-binding sensor domain-containing protein